MLIGRDEKEVIEAKPKGMTTKKLLLPPTSIFSGCMEINELAGDQVDSSELTKCRFETTLIDVPTGTGEETII